MNTKGAFNMAQLIMGDELIARRAQRQQLNATALQPAESLGAKSVGTDQPDMGNHGAILPETLSQTR
jgi:hypothetical protein